MTSLIDTSKPLEVQNEKLLQIVNSLMGRVEQDVDRSGAAYAQFERAVLLEDEVELRTRSLKKRCHFSPSPTNSWVMRYERKRLRVPTYITQLKHWMTGLHCLTLTKISSCSTAVFAAPLAASAKS